MLTFHAILIFAFGWLTGVFIFPRVMHALGR